MSESITTGPLVTYTYTCAVCGERYEGIGPHCLPKPDPYTRVEFEPLGDMAAKAWLKAMDTQPDAPHIWNAVSRAVAAEVLSDPARWARDLGIPLAKSVDGRAYLQARIGTVKQMLGTLTDSDLLSRLSMESHLAQLEAELAEFGHQMAPDTSKSSTEP